eukprot:11688518-Alexandrium_andersonii.AAC.1
MMFEREYIDWAHGLSAPSPVALERAWQADYAPEPCEQSGSTCHTLALRSRAQMSFGFSSLPSCELFCA